MNMTFTLDPAIFPKIQDVLNEIHALFTMILNVIIANKITLTDVWNIWQEILKIIVLLKKKQQV